ncbi:MAG: hypothetical protein ACK5NT_03015 [Pyrinomonadaceae bacterium]
MAISEELKKELKKKKETMEKNKEYVRLREFYIEMQEIGIAKKAEYDLPPLDTIGRHSYEISHYVPKKKIC